MSKKLTEISPNLTIPGFDVTVHSPHSCQVKSQDGRHEFSVEINESFEYPLLRISGNSVIETWVFRLGAWNSGGIEFTKDADDAITQVATLFKLKDKLSSEGFSAKIDNEWLVLSHSSKPGYSLQIWLADARKIAATNNSPIYTRVRYYGPAAYYYVSDRKWQAGLNNERLIVTNKGLEELAQELKARILSMEEEKDPRITQWVSEEIEKELVSQGFTFTPKPGKGTVEFSHPTGLSGTLSFAPFTLGALDFSPKFPNLQFPTDIEGGKVVSFTCDRPNYREPYTKAFLAKEPRQVINEIRGFLALPLVYQEVCNAWKSDLLEPKLRHSKMLLVNTELDDKNIILELTLENSMLVLKAMMGERGMKAQRFYIPTGDDTKAIAKDIVVLAENHVQEFIQKTGYIKHTRIVQEIPELDF